MAFLDLTNDLNTNIVLEFAYDIKKWSNNFFILLNPQMLSKLSFITIYAPLYALPFKVGLLIIYFIRKTDFGNDINALANKCSYFEIFRFKIWLIKPLKSI